eukprot:g9129.t1
MTSQKIGNYIIGPTLGEGGFSVVKLGTHESTGEKVALKILKNKHKMSDNARQQVERETMIMKKGKPMDVILIVLELATGGELFEFLSHTGYFSEPLARTYMKQLLSGLAHCHSKGIAHRDLKPENLLMDSNFNLKIADFGFANVITATQKAMFTECGTPGYMAPEMQLHTGYDGPTADIWSCGVILFILLAGFPPFQRPAMSDWWFNKLANGKQSLFWQAHCRNAKFSDSCKDLIERMLATDPKKRITLPELEKHEWLNGPTLQPQQFTLELTKRKKTVDSIKQREKERKAMDDMEVDGDGDAVMRGEGKARADDDALPTELPTISMGAFVYDKPTVGASLESYDEDESSPQEKQIKKLDTTVTRYTRFPSTQNPATVISRITEVVKANGGRTAEAGDAYSVKIELRGITCVAEVFKGDDGSLIVDFRKKQGESSKFRTLFADVRAQVPDLLATA